MHVVFALFLFGFVLNSYYTQFTGYLHSLFSRLLHCHRCRIHYNDVIISVMASQFTSLTIVYSSVYSGADQRKHQSSGSLVFVWGIHRWPMNSPHKGLVTRKNVSIWWRHHVVNMCKSTAMNITPRAVWMFLEIYQFVYRVNVYVIAGHYEPVWHQSITWAFGDPDSWRYMALLGNCGLI